MWSIVCILLATTLVCAAQTDSYGQAGSTNLVPNWQFDSTNGWQQFDSTLVNIRWTDGRLIRAAKCTEETHTGCYTCWSISPQIPINPDKAYEFSIYIKSTGIDLNNYFGFYAYDQSGQLISGSWSNPYFKWSENDPDRWVAWTGYILPRYIHHTDGRADDQSDHTNGNDWVWPSDAAFVALRFGSCYGTGVGTLDRTWYAFPAIREIEPQLAGSLPIPIVKRFDIGNPQQWQQFVPSYGGVTFVNGQYTPVARIVESGTGCYGGGYTVQFKIDHRKKYEFSIWISSTATDLDNYLGFYAYDVSHNQITTGTIRNPYFKTGQNDVLQWTRWNGFVLPSNTPSSSVNPNKPASDVPSHFSNGVDWKWPSNAVYAILRFLTCYGNGDNSGITYFALPQVIESDLQL